MSKAQKKAEKGVEAVAPAKPSRRRRQPEDVKARILAEATNAFATRGFEGTTVRSVALDANVPVSLLFYHYPTKDVLWRAVIEDIRAKTAPDPHFDEIDEKVSAADKLRDFIRYIVHRSADTPDLHRLMSQEAHDSTDRLHWLCERYIKKDFRRLTDLIGRAQKDGDVIDINPGRLRYAIIAMAALPFSVSAEYKILTDRNPFSRAEIDATIDTINSFVFKNK